MKKFIAFMFTLIVPVVLTIVTGGASPGCAAIVSALPDIIAVVTDGAQILDAIESFVVAWFVQHPDAAAQVKVAEAITKARIALNIALKTAQGAKDVNDQQVDTVFNDFKAAYLELLALVKPYGVTPQSQAKMLRAQPGVLYVPAEAPTPKKVGAK